MEPGTRVEIVPFEPRYAADFKRLNVEWLKRYFTVEPIDEAVLSRPEAVILAPGGAILLARVAPDTAEGHPGEVVGTCALIKADGEDRYELSKMAVTERYQGQGIARRLLLAAIEHYRSIGGRQLFLESNSRLTPALTLYESVGFEHAPRPGGPSHYVRSDVYMVLREAGDRRFQSASADPNR